MDIKLIVGILLLCMLYYTVIEEYSFKNISLLVMVVISLYMGTLIVKKKDKDINRESSYIKSPPLQEEFIREQKLGNNV